MTTDGLWGNPRYVQSDVPREIVDDLREERDLLAALLVERDAAIQTFIRAARAEAAQRDRLEAKLASRQAEVARLNIVIAAAAATRDDENLRLQAVIEHAIAELRRSEHSAAMVADDLAAALA